MTPEAKKHCEELADKWHNGKNFAGIENYHASANESFCAGFQAGYSYNEEKLRVAIEALEKYKTSAFEINGQVYKVGSKAEEALAKIRGENDVK